MTFGFFSGRGRIVRLVSKIFISIGVSLICRIGDAADAAPASGDDLRSEDEPTDTQFDDDAFFEGLGDIEDEGYESVVVGKRIRVTDETSGFAETVDVTETAARFTTAADVLSRSVGVQVRKTGGVGSSASLGIRGSTARQVPVLLDGMEIGGAGSTAVNLGDFSLDLLESVEIYRGAAPVSVGRSGIGGAVSLRTQPLTRPFTGVSASAGSFGTRRLSVGHGTPIGDANGLATLSVQHTDGDFLYLNRNGTPYTATDDSIEIRTNNQMTSYGALLKFDGPVRRSWRWTLGEALFSRQGGAPGIENLQTASTSADRMRNHVYGRLEGPVGDKTRASLTTGYTRTVETFRDPFGEFKGLASAQQASPSDRSEIQTASAHIIPAHGLVSVQWQKAGTTDVSLDNRFESLERVQHTAEETHVLNVVRDRFAAGIAHRWQPVALLSIDSALRLDLEHSRVVDDVSDARTEPFFSPSLGVKYEPLSWLTLRTGVGRYVRTPDLDELYGAFGAVMGNPDLNAETALNGDAGATAMYTTDRGTSFKAEAAWFCSYAEDLIVYEQNSQHTIRPENVGKAVIQGAETGLRIGVADVFSLQANYTYLYAINRSDVTYYAGKRLPGRPVHQVYGKLEVGDDGGEPVGSRLWFDADFVGETYLKQSNQSASEVPARLFVGFGYRLSHEKSGTSLTLEVHNLLNQITAETRDGRNAPISDFTGFPLPGREVFITFAWKG